MKYEHKDFGDLLIELNTKKDAGDSLVREKYVESMSTVSRYLSGDMSVTDDDCAAAMEDVIFIFKSLSLRDSHMWKDFAEMTGCDDRKEASKINTWLNSLNIAFESQDEGDIGFFGERLQLNSCFQEYAGNFCSYTPGEEPEPEPETVSPEEQAMSDRQNRIASNEKIRYIVDTANHMIHDKSCQIGLDLPVDRTELLEEYDGTCTACPACEMKAYVRTGARDFENYYQYEKLFGLMGIDARRAREMYITYGVKTKISHMLTEGYEYSSLYDNAITIWYLEDRWRIGLTDRKKVRLEHNNYRRQKHGTRVFVEGYHVQNDYTYSTTIAHALKIIREYRYENHFRQPEVVREEKPSVQTPEAPKIEKKRSLFGRIHDFFLFRKKERNPLRDIRYVEKDGLPADGTICLYQWKGKGLKKHWSCGAYSEKKKRFSMNYGNNAVRTNTDKVVKWIALEDIRD